MSMAMIDDIIDGIRNTYSTWSSNLSFATTHVDNSALIDPIILNRSISDDQLDSKFTETIIEGISKELKNSEIRHFLNQLNQHQPSVERTTTQIEMVDTFNDVYSKLFQIRSPDFIIWSEGIRGAFTRNTSIEEMNAFNELTLRGETIQNQFDDIILGIRQLCGKTYRENRLNVLQNRNIDTRSTDLAFGINQRLDFSSEFTYARITIT